MDRQSHSSSLTQTELRDQILARHYHYLDQDRNILYSGTNSGFFSNCSKSLWCLIELANIGIFPRTLNFSRGYQNFKDSDNSRDIYSDLFATDNFLADYIKTTLAPHHRLRCPDHHGVYAIYPYKEVNLFTRAYFHPSERIKSLVAEITAKYAIDYTNTIAICYRGTDKGTEVRLADPANYVDEVLRLRTDGMKVLVQTDQEQIKQHFLECIDGAFVLEEMPTTAGNTVLHALDQNSLGISKFAFGERVLASAYVISKCRYVVNHSGNMAAWICLLRGSGNGVSQFSKNGTLVGPYQIMKGHLKNTYRQLRRFVRNDVSCYT